MVEASGNESAVAVEAKRARVDKRILRETRFGKGFDVIWE
jgi:hypothetical protein